MNPDKKYYKIGEISEYLNINTSVLRFWEKKFPQLRVKKNKNNGHRRYTQKDFELIKKIYDLLYNKKMKIEGAVKLLSSGVDYENSKVESQKIKSEREYIKEELEELKKLIEEL